MRAADPILQAVARHFGRAVTARDEAGSAAAADTKPFRLWARSHGLEVRDGRVTPAELDRLLTPATAVVLSAHREGSAEPSDERGLSTRSRIDEACRTETARVLFRLGRGRIREVCSWGDVREASRAADLVEGDGSVQALVISEPTFHGGGAAGLKPFARLYQLMRPEFGEIGVVAVFAVFAGLLALATPLAVEALVNTVAFNRVYYPVVVLAFLLFAFLAFEAGVKTVQTYVVELLQRRTYVRLVAALSRGLPRVAPRAYDDQFGPALVNHFFDVVTVQKVTASLLLDALTLVVTALVGMVVLAFYHPFLLGYDIGLLLAITVILSFVGRGAVQTAIKESKAKYRTAAWLEELARRTRAFRQYGGPAFATRTADKIAGDYLGYRAKHFRVLLRQIISILLLQAVASTVLLGLGGALVIRGQLNLGQLVAAELIVALVVGAFAKLIKHVESYYDLLAGIDKIGVLLDLPRDQCEGIETPGEPGEPIAVSAVDLVLGLPGHPLPRHIDFTLAPGERVALVGPSGSGKSMLCEVLAGQRSRLGGQLTLDEFAPEELSGDARARRVAHVRDNEIVAATVAENVSFGRAEVTNAVVRDALNRVGLTDDVIAIGGLDTPLLADGRPFTELQARRLTLARAIAGRPGLLIIDGLLDPFADDEIGPLADVLFDENAPWTLVLVSGRGPLVDRCDRTIEIGSQPTYVVRRLAAGGGGSDNGNGDGGH